MHFYKKLRLLASTESFLKLSDVGELSVSYKSLKGSNLHL